MERVNFSSGISRRHNKDHRGVDLISDALPFGRLYGAHTRAVDPISECTFC